MSIATTPVFIPLQLRPLLGKIRYTVCLLLLFAASLQIILCQRYKKNFQTAKYFFSIKPLRGKVSIILALNGRKKATILLLWLCKIPILMHPVTVSGCDPPRHSAGLSWQGSTKV